MVTAYKLISLLLCYPDAQLHELRAEIDAAARELPTGDAPASILTFLETTSGWDLEDAQQAYIGTFDFNPRASLYLTYPYHGDRRQRGVALLKLRRLYDSLGLRLSTDELPDYLPLVLELADMLAPADARGLLGEFRAAIELAAAALHDQQTPYMYLFAALTALLGPASEHDLDNVLALAAQGPPSEEVGLHPFVPPEQMPVAGALR